MSIGSGDFNTGDDQEIIDRHASDPPPFAAVHPLQAVVLDWDTEHRGEPFFTVTREVEWANGMKDLGCVNVEAYAIGAQGYPYVVRGSKAA